MKCFGQIGRLRPEKIEEYKYLHSVAVHTPKWQGVLDTIRACHLQNYHIYIHKDVVTAFFEYTGDDYDADMARMAEDPLTREWWTHTKPCFRKYEEDIEELFYVDMEEIFDLDAK